jgi:8-oxo-dGTP pyrophosphatase MutT (NUDIX family)
MVKGLLGTTTDGKTFDRASFDRLKTVRYGAFGLLMSGGLAAVMYAANEGHHELPGGGAENDETPAQNFQREILEETGYDATDLVKIGVIREVWSTDDAERFSTFFIARTVNEPHQVVLTKKEIQRGITLKWLPFKELSQLIEDETPQTPMGKMKHARDVIALMALSKRKDIPERYF